LTNQTKIYMEASSSNKDIKVVLCYTISEIEKVQKILKELKLSDEENVVIIDATPKKSAWVASRTFEQLAGMANQDLIDNPKKSWFSSLSI